MKKILIPLDGTERSKKSIELVQDLYMPESIEVILLVVREDLDMIRSKMEYEDAKKEIMPILDEAEELLKSYNISKHVSFGRAGEEILETAKLGNADIIVMTKSTRKGWVSMIGSVTTHVVKYATCIVMIVPE